MENFVNHLQELISSKIKITRGIFTLFKLEARLASLSFYHLLIFFAAIALLFITCWLTSMLLVGYLIAWSTGYILAAIVGVLILNIGLLIYALKGASIKLKQMTFEKTRASLAKKLPRESYEYREKIVHDDFHPGSQNTPRTN